MRTQSSRDRVVLEAPGDDALATNSEGLGVTRGPLETAPPERAEKG